MKRESNDSVQEDTMGARGTGVGGLPKWASSPVLAGFVVLAAAACGGEEPAPSSDGAGEERVEERGPAQAEPEAAGDGEGERTSGVDREQEAVSGQPTESPSGDATEAGKTASAGESESRSEPDRPSPTLAAGTVLTLEVPETISTRTHEVGDPITLHLTEGVAGSEGAVVPAGARAEGHVVEAARSTDAEEEAVLRVSIESVRVDGVDRPVAGEIQGADLEAAAGDSRRRSAAKVATGTAVGAVTGRILGGDRRSAAAGAAAGAVAGTGVALVTRDGHAELPEGALITYQLTEPLILR